MDSTSTRNTKLLEKDPYRKSSKHPKSIGISKYPLISVMNEKRDKCLILMLNLKVSKQTRSEASKNKVIIKSIKHINKLSKSK